jgi:hypothetical protein
VGRGFVRWLPWPEPASPDELLAEPTLGRRVLAAFLDVVAFVLVSVAVQAALILVGWWPATDDGQAASGPVATVLGVWVPAALALVAVPLWRRDGASIGQVAVCVRPVADGTGGDGPAGAPPTRADRLRRAAVRWAPLVLASTIAGPLTLLVFVGAALAELVVAGRRSDHRSLAGRWSRTTVVAAALPGVAQVPT